MTHPALPVALLALAAPAAAAVGDDLGRVQMAQITVHERVIVRVPRMSARARALRPSLPTPTKWKEKKGPKCLAVGDMAGALISEPGTVDLVLAGNHRLRARLDKDCGPLDFYSGFYLRPAADGQVCAGRDEIRMRSGTRCAITTFRTLLPAR